MLLRLTTALVAVIVQLCGLATAEPANPDWITLAQAKVDGGANAAERAAVPQQSASEQELKRRINAWVIGVAAGKLEGAPIRLVEEMSRVLDDGDEMQVLPIVTRGPSYNVHALLYLRGIDLAVINGDVLDYFAREQNISNITGRINYVTQLFNSELHVLARPEIKSLDDLAGKSVNFNTVGTSAAFTGPIIFDRLGIKAEKTFVPHPVAMAEMKKSDKYAAVVFVTAKPVRPLTAKTWPEGFHLLSVPFNDNVSDYYLPASLSADDYPDLISGDTTVQTIAVPTVLAAFNWSRDHPRGRRIARFVDYLFDRFSQLRKEPFHPKWREINLAAEIPGWNRLPAVQDKLNELAKTALLKAASSTGGPVSQEEEALFEEFLRWRSQQASRQ